MKSTQTKKSAVSGVSTGSLSLHQLVECTISADGYAAFVTIKSLSPTLQLVSADIIEFLKEKTITYGVRLTSVNDIITTIKNGPVDKNIQIAFGKPLVEGRDALEEYQFRTSLMAGKIEDKKIDFRERGIINNVSEGQVIARFVSETAGKPGMRVDGVVVKPAPVKKVSIPKAGANVTMRKEADAFVFVSAINGHARIIFNEIQVMADFIINGDLDFTKGNIDFVGNVEVVGTVKNGFKIIAGGDVIIGHDVEPEAYIQAKGSVTVKKTVNCGKNGGKICAGKSIHADRIINSVVEAKENICVKDEVIESELHCGGKFITSWGKVIGSTIEAIGGMVCHNVGIENGNATNHLFAGLTFAVFARLTEIDKELDRIRTELGLLTKKVSTEELSYQSDEFHDLDASEKDRIKRIGLARNKHAKQLKEQQDLLQNEKKTLMPLFQVNQEAVIEIKGCIYPTCYIRVGEQKEVKILDERMQKCKITAGVDSSEKPQQQSS